VEREPNLMLVNAGAAEQVVGQHLLYARPCWEEPELLIRATFKAADRSDFPIFSLYEIHHLLTIVLMNTIVQVNPRGTLTLPKAVRKALGISTGGGIVMLSMRENEVALQPTAAFPIEMYTEARVAEFDAADAELRQALATKAKK